MIESLIFLVLGSWALTASFYAIDLLSDKENYQAELKLALEQRAYWMNEAAKWSKQAAANTFEAHDLGDEDRDRPSDCYMLHADLYGGKEI